MNKAINYLKERGISTFSCFATKYGIIIPWDLASQVSAAELDSLLPDGFNCKPLPPRPQDQLQASTEQVQYHPALAISRGKDAFQHLMDMHSSE